ncbi:hypothetical protein J3R75_002747 [Oligosphaera ethanolica]|uniref:Uncharacterized protein n=1 Tax=Oligosphaera ethanolica TaxID=760260 RepID=A0AAE3VHT2_9BACT|nr:hypothetical protein [Oligosphaera ethanolica]
MPVFHGFLPCFMLFLQNSCTILVPTFQPTKTALFSRISRVLSGSGAAGRISPGAFSCTNFGNSCTKSPRVQAARVMPCGPRCQRRRYAALAALSPPGRASLPGGAVALLMPAPSIMTAAARCYTSSRHAWRGRRHGFQGAALSTRCGSVEKGSSAASITIPSASPRGASFWRFQRFGRVSGRVGGMRRL